MRSSAEFAPMDAPMPAASDGDEASGTIDRVRAVCELAAGFVDGTALAARLADIRDRLDGALRIAIAGRVKAGKSTLLNALVGERLAPTDAGECTRVVTWYQFGPAYDVSAVASDGAVTSLAFRRVNGALQFDLGSLALDDEPRDDDRPNRADPGEPRIVVSWPSSSLRNVTLIDTPGLDSLSSANSLRTAAFLALGEQRPSDADAVIYLMRHLHRLDAEFLGSFMDRSVANSSPVNSVAVLSRADEVGAGRLDALASARRIADRYQHNETLRTLCTAVVPIAGLIAETGLTLREDEVRALRTVAATPEPVLERMLRSADAFCEPESSELTVEIRRELLDRLGMFGVRFCADQLRDRAACTGPELAELLVAESGLDAIRALIMDVFLPRAHVLKARAAVAGLRLLARELELLDPVHARQLAQQSSDASHRHRSSRSSACGTWCCPGPWSSTERNAMSWVRSPIGAARWRNDSAPRPMPTAVTFESPRSLVSNGGGRRVRLPLRTRRCVRHARPWPASTKGCSFTCTSPVRADSSSSQVQRAPTRKGEDRVVLRRVDAAAQHVAVVALQRMAAAQSGVADERKA